MSSPGTFIARIVDWEDAAFVRTFDEARAQAFAEGLVRYGPRAAARVEQLLRERGYPLARVDCERSVEEALRRTARWTVSARPSPGPGPRPSAAASTPG